MSRLIDQHGDPYGGGWMNWPAGLPLRLAVIRQYEKAITLYKANAGNPKWVNANTHIFTKVTEVFKLRQEAGYVNYMF